MAPHHKDPRSFGVTMITNMAARSSNRRSVPPPGPIRVVYLVGKRLQKGNVVLYLVALVHGR